MGKVQAIEPLWSQALRINLRSTINVREAYNNLHIRINMVSVQMLTMSTLGKPLCSALFLPLICETIRN